MIPKRPCPYEDCGCSEVWYWGWYEREEGSLPLGDGDGAAGAILLRRFKCTACGRTFSWRPLFLLFGRRYAALFYQLKFKSWALGQCVAGHGGWCDLGEAGRKAFSRFLGSRAAEFLDRLGTKVEPAGRRMKMWQLARQFVRSLLSAQQRPPSLSIHLVCLALARHPQGVRYSLSSL